MTSADAVPKKPGGTAKGDHPDEPSVDTQLFGTVDPATNATRPVGEMRPPYNAPAPGTDATMTGFAVDYHNKPACRGRSTSTRSSSSR